MKKLKLTRILSSALILVSALALSPIGASAEWRENSVGWWYAESNSWATGWRNIDGKWYYFDLNGYMAHDTNIGGYQLGSDGAWIVPTPTASTTTTSSTSSGKTGDIIGFDQMELSSQTPSNLRQYYNKSHNVINKINELSIGGNDYLNTYKSGNILSPKHNQGYSDYIFDLNGNYSRFTALAGIDDYLDKPYFIVTGNDDTVDTITGKIKNKELGLKIKIIADGYVLDTEDLYYGEEPKEIDVNNLDKYNQLIIRVECEETNGMINFDILGGKFYHK